MAWLHAGKYGPDDLRDKAGRNLPGTTELRVVAVGTDLLVALYDDRDRSTARLNPFLLGTGNVEVYAEPGDYELVVPGGGRLRITAQPDPRDVDANPGAGPSVDRIEVPLIGPGTDTGVIVHGMGVDPVDAAFVEGTGDSVIVHRAGLEIVVSTVSARAFVGRPMSGIFVLSF